MPSIVLKSRSPEETKRIGAAMGRCLEPGDVLLLCGDLGAGKTCLTQGIARGLGIQGYVRSPTFVLVSIHQGRLPLYHMDIYRLDHVAEVLDLGLEEYLAGDGVSVIEWADKALEAFPQACMRVVMELEPEPEREDHRILRLEPGGERYERLALQLQEELSKDDAPGATGPGQTL